MWGHREVTLPIIIIHKIKEKPTNANHNRFLNVDVVTNNCSIFEIFRDWNRIWIKERYSDLIKAASHIIGSVFYVNLTKFDYYYWDNGLP